MTSPRSRRSHPGRIIHEVDANSFVAGNAAADGPFRYLQWSELSDEDRLYMLSDSLWGVPAD
jgi:hypothetical protein